MTKTDGKGPRISFSSATMKPKIARKLEADPNLQGAARLAAQCTAHSFQSLDDLTHMDGYESDPSELPPDQFFSVSAAQDLPAPKPSLRQTNVSLARDAMGRAAGFVSRNLRVFGIAGAILVAFSLVGVTTVIFFNPPANDVARSAGNTVLDTRPNRTGASASNPSEETSAQTVLAGLIATQANPSVNAAFPSAEDKFAAPSNDQLQALRDAVLAGDYTVQVAEGDGANRLGLRVENAAVSQDETVLLLLAAAEKSEIALSTGIRTAEGTLDADTRLFNLVQTSLATDGTPEGRNAARVYVVEQGDSLAHISLQFYGRPGAFARIFNANRDVLASTEALEVGHQLKIPG